MSGTIRIKGRSGWTGIPNHRVEDQSLDPYEFRVAVWLASHDDTYLRRLSANEIGVRLGISKGKLYQVLARLETLRIIEREVAVDPETRSPRTTLWFDTDVWEAPRSVHVVDETEGGAVATRPGAVATRPGGGRLVDSLPTTRKPVEDQLEHHHAVAHDSSTTVDFAAFWASYPRKTDRKRSEAAWRALTGRQRTEAMNALPAWAAYWMTREPEFTPHPTTWLRGERWTDELPRPSKPNGHTPNTPSIVERTNSVLRTLAEREATR